MELSLAVVELSDSFAELWPALGRDLGLAVTRLPGTSGTMVPGDAVAVLLAAGGAERDALEWLDEHEVPPGVPVFAVGADPGRRVTSQLVCHGSRDYFALPEDLELLRNAVSAAATRRRNAMERAHAALPADTAEAFAEIIGSSPALKEVLSRAARILPHVDATALIIGETGTGKELLARALHFAGVRKRAPFVPVNCSALPAQLIESELFGHERGAFTSAHAAKPGLFEVADGGTLFLDEIGTVSPDLQAKLLRVLEDREIRRVGGTRSRRVDVRIIAATNENLEAAIEDGSFRRDLYFRLSVVTLTLPPLRDRGDDIVEIAEALLKRLALQHDVTPPPLTTEARRALTRHAWPGNVRELRNAIERALLLSPPGELHLDELMPEGRRRISGGHSPIPFPATLDDIERAAARATLAHCGNNRSEAARQLGISRRRLRRLLNEADSGA